jgi:hypothetical protein
MVIYGWIRRVIWLATKPDLCATEADVVPHDLIRVVSFVHIFWLPILPYRVRHVLVCRGCGAETGIGWREVRAAMASGQLPRPPRRDWPGHARQVFETTGRTPREAELDPIEINPKRGPWDLYLKVWLIVVPAAIVGLVILSLLP